MNVALHDEVRPHPAAVGAPTRLGRLVAVVGAHGGAGATRAAVAIARDAGQEAWLLDADLCGGDAHIVLGLPARAGDVGLAAVQEASAGVLTDGARRVPFGWLFEISPRPDLAWLIRDGALRELARAAMRMAPLVVVDAGRPTGPALEPVVDADVVVLIAHANRPDALERARRRLVRAGVDERRVLECATAPSIVERTLGRLRRDVAVIDVERDDQLLLLIEGRLAALGPRERG